MSMKIASRSQKVWLSLERLDYYMAIQYNGNRGEFMAITKINPRVFYANVRAMRDDKEWTQAQLAAKIGLDAKTYSNKERAIANRVPMDLAQKIAEALGTTVESLATGEEPEEPLFNPEIVSFFNRVRNKRESMGISQKAMAELLDMSPTNWQTKESGKVTRLPSSLMEQIAKVLGCTLDELREEKTILNPINVVSSIDKVQVIDNVVEKPRETVAPNSSAYDMSHLPKFVQRFISNPENKEFITNMIDKELERIQG